jgi:site-specific DNA-methyltransferase (adenine-specific)
LKVTEKITITNEDNMTLMSRYPDKYFDLAIVDPPYEIADNPSHHGGSGKLKNRTLNKSKKKFKEWDKMPSKEYFNELFRVSKNQIIWGGNYFELPRTRGFIVWDKQQPFPNFSACEYAWTSFYVPAKIFVQATTRTNEKKIHPTQKSVKLYEYCLHHFAKENDKILETHLGSGSIAIACHERGFELVACEIDKDYFDASIKRIKNHISQQRLF